MEDLKHGNAEAAVAGDVVTALSEIFEGGHFDRIIQKELEVQMVTSWLSIVVMLVLAAR